MTIEPLGLRRPTLSKSSKKTKSMIVILAIVLIILIFGVATGMREAQSSHTKQAPAYYTSAYCESKVLTLAAHGVVTAVEGFNGAMDECTHAIGPNSIYGEASM
jgi:predicted transporter